MTPPRFLTTWLSSRAHARRGRLLEQAVKRAQGDLAMVDAALETMVKSDLPLHLSVRHQAAHDLYGLFLPCWTRKRH